MLVAIRLKLSDDNITEGAMEVRNSLLAKSPAHDGVMICLNACGPAMCSMSKDARSELALPRQAAPRLPPSPLTAGDAYILILARTHRVRVHGLVGAAG